MMRRRSTTHPHPHDTVIFPKGTIFGRWWRAEDIPQRRSPIKIAPRPPQTKEQAEALARPTLQCKLADFARHGVNGVAELPKSRHGATARREPR